MRTQFTFYKSFDDIMEDLTDKQIAQYMRALLDVQFLRVRIEDVKFDDKILSIVWKSQRHSIQTSIDGYIASQQNSKVKTPYLGVYAEENTPKADKNTPSEGGKIDPYEGGRQQEQEQVKEQEQEQVKEQEQEQVKEQEQYAVGQSHDDAPQPPEEPNSNLIREIISHLNQVAKSNYKPSTPKTRSLINTRLKEGFTLDDFKQVHIIKYSEWVGTDFEKFIRPETLYSNKFEGYLNQKTTDYQKLKAINNHTGLSALDMLKQQGYA